MQTKPSTLIRLPNWLGDVVMALPIIRAIHAQGTHKITLLAQPQFKPFLSRLNCFDDVIYLPKKGWGYYPKIRQLKQNHFDQHVLFTYSERTDIEARLIAAPKRYGILRHGKKRRLLTNHFPLTEQFDEVHTHQTRLFTEFAFKSQLLPTNEIDLSPLVKYSTSPSKTIGLICGTENTPTKRWPVSHWIQFINAFTEQKPHYQLLLLGTGKDKIITDEISHAMAPHAKATVQNLAGTTDLSGFMDKLCECELVICNDTGGMHLANALGVPVVSLFGPTNPVRTGPIFEGKGTVLQPKDAPSIGGVDISDITVDDVLKTALNVIQQ